MTHVNRGTHLSGMLSKINSEGHISGLPSDAKYDDLTLENLEQFGIERQESSSLDKREIYGARGLGGLGGIDGLGVRGDLNFKNTLSKSQRKKYEKQRRLEVNDLKFLFRNIDFEAK